MQEVNWGNFKAKFNGKEQDSFQWLCYLLFCIEHNQSLGISRYANHAGVETSPIIVGDDHVGWQAKFYDTRLSEHTSDFIASIDTAKTKHPEITKLQFYTNQDFGQNPQTGKDPDYKTKIEKHAKTKGISIDWRTAGYFESPFVTAENEQIAKHFFGSGKSTIDLIDALNQHTVSILAPIQSKIELPNGEIKIDRSPTITALSKSLENSVLTILSGEGGTGKTAAIKELHESSREEVPLFVFKAHEFNNLSHISQAFRNYGEFTLADFATTYPDLNKKCVVIDSAEKLADIDNKEVFQELLNSLEQNGWKVIFTTRRTYLVGLQYLLADVYGFSFQSLDIENLTPHQLVSYTSAYNFSLPNDSKLLELIRNPFYLDKYLQFHGSLSTNISYAEFKNMLWDRQIAKVSSSSHARRVSCFLALVRKRVNDGSFFVPADDFDAEALAQLESDEIITYDRNAQGYFVTHDIYEEWALEKIIESTFYRDGGAAHFYQELGSSLPIRRAFRQWLSDKLATNREIVKTLVETTLSDEGVEKFWRDEVIIAVLLSDHAKVFFELFERELLANDASFLINTTFLLRIACKEADEDFLRMLGIEKTQGLSLKTLFTKPRGSGWDFVIDFINREKELLKLKGLSSIVELLDDWIAKHKSGPTTRSASQIALFYYKEIANNGGFGHRSNILEEKIIRVILNGTSEIKAELSEIIDEIVSKRQTSHRDPYNELAQAMLSSALYTSEVANAIPDKIIELAEVLWIDDSDPEEGFWGRSIDLDEYFGLRSSQHDYYPPSAFQTPALHLLRSAPDQSIDFIINLTNYAVEKYAKSSLSESELEEVKVNFNDGETRTQYISGRLWLMYRGTHVASSLLQSVHMVLEKWLLEYGKEASSEDIEKICMHLLKQSKSASITAVVASIVLAYPHKLFNIAQILFKTKEFFLYDTARYTQDLSHKGSLESLKHNFPRNYKTEIHQDERIKACDDEHRKHSLEATALAFQFFKTEDESDESSEAKQKAVWEILDMHYSQLPDESKEIDSDKTWRLYLARMDRRIMKPTTEQKDGKILIHFNPEIDPALKQYSDDSLKKSSNALKHVPLELWSYFRWDNNKEKYQNYEQFESSHEVVIQEVKEIVDELKKAAGSEEAILDRAIPAYACSVLVRDFLDKLKADELQFCEEVILEYASLLLRDGYRYQIGDGVDAAIDVLPILFNHSSRDTSLIKGLIFQLLFNSYPVGMNGSVGDYALRAILYRFWENNFQDAHSLFLGYLMLKPKYDDLIEEMRGEKLKQGVYQLESEEILDAFETKHRDQLDHITSNAISFEEVGDLSNLDLETLKTAFEMLPFGTQNQEHRQFILTILPIFAQKLSDRDTERAHRVSQRFINKLAYFILKSEVDDIEVYLKPITENLTVSEFTEDLLSELVSTEDMIKQYEQFWCVWDMLYDKIVEICKQHDWNPRTKAILQNYLLAWPYWKDDAREWHSLKNKNKVLFKRVSDDLGGNTIILYSLSKILYDIGSNFIDDGIIWLSDMLENHKNLYEDKLETNTIYYLENVIRRFVLKNRLKIKTDSQLKKRVIVVLNFLIEKGSAAAYLTREDIL